MIRKITPIVPPRSEEDGDTTLQHPADVRKPDDLVTRKGATIPMRKSVTSKRAGVGPNAHEGGPSRSLEPPGVSDSFSNKR